MTSVVEAAAAAGRDRLMQAIGHRFRDPALLVRALTHRSVGPDNNERLEFLGDGLLNFAIGAELFARRDKASEGDLSRARASLVREETLADAARRLGLEQLVRQSPAELRSGGFKRKSALADALEAIIGAVYLDAGYEPAAAVARRMLAAELDTLPDAALLKDHKTQLQEWLQARARPLPGYEVIAEDGPPHRRIFRVRASLADAADTAEAEGTSRRLGEQRAAAVLLAQLKAQS